MSTTAVDLAVAAIRRASAAQVPARMRRGYEIRSAYRAVRGAARPIPASRAYALARAVADSLGGGGAT